MANILIQSETQTDHGWRYHILVTQNNQSYTFEVSLSWSEHDLWSHGRVAPEKVVRAAFRFLLSREPAAEILSRFDCAVIRRYFPDADQHIPTLLAD